MHHVLTTDAVDIGFVKPPHPVPASSRRPRHSLPRESEVWLETLVEVLAEAGNLTPAERAVLEPLLLGRRYSEIATILGKSPHTVGVQVKMILRRLGASNSRDLLRVFLCALDHDRRLPQAAP